MTWAILLMLVVIVGVMSLSGRRQVPWAHRMQRVNAGARFRSEWMAPDTVRRRVHEDFLAAMRWLPESMLHDWSRQWNTAPHFLSGAMLKRHQEILKRYQLGKVPRYTGVLRSTHQVEVRHFSDDGERCLVIDRQTARRMATYDYRTGQRIMTQDLGDGVVVYEMAYDKHANCWKIDRTIQELPAGWSSRDGRHVRSRIDLLSALPPSIGRDN